MPPQHDELTAIACLMMLKQVRYLLSSGIWLRKEIHTCSVRSLRRVRGPVSPQPAGREKDDPARLLMALSASRVPVPAGGTA
jgi:hypothetical protein